METVRMSRKFKVVASTAVLKEVKSSTTYTTPYTGEAIQPSKSDLGTLSITYIDKNSTSPDKNKQLEKLDPNSI